MCRRAVVGPSGCGREAGNVTSSDASSDGRPVVFIVDADGEACAATRSALVSRFGADYQVASADSARAGLDALERLVCQGGRVALVAADLHLPGMDGVDFLDHAHMLHRRAGRALLLAMDEYRT